MEVSRAASPPREKNGRGHSREFSVKLRGISQTDFLGPISVDAFPRSYRASVAHGRRAASESRVMRSGANTSAVHHATTQAGSAESHGVFRASPRLLAASFINELSGIAA